MQEGGKPHMDPNVMLDLFQNKLNHTEVKLAAIFDLFTSQCDRHQQNYFMNEHGKLWAIDNDQVHHQCVSQCKVGAHVCASRNVAVHACSFVRVYACMNVFSS